MIISRITNTALLCSLGLTVLHAQETRGTWDIEVPASIVPEVPAVKARKPDPIPFEILSSRSKHLYVRQTPEMHDLPPIEGRIKMTIQRVANPELVDPIPLPPPIPPNDPEVITRLQELRETYRANDLVFLSATVYMAEEGAENARTLLRIYPNGQAGEEVVAWSNINFLHLTGHGSYRVKHSDGTSQDVGLLMGIGPVYGETARRMAERTTQAEQGDNDIKILAMKDFAASGPDFQIIKGSDESPAMDTLEQLHDLFGKSGQSLKEQYLAREKAREERKAFLLLNPPKPKDVTIRVWSRTATHNQKEASR